MNDLQSNVFHYLTDGGDRWARTTALKILVEKGWFNEATGVRSDDELRQIVQLWRDHGTFCAEGIDRFEDAIFPRPPEWEITLTTTVRVRGDHGRPWGEWFVDRVKTDLSDVTPYEHLSTHTVVADVKRVDK